MVLFYLGVVIYSCLTLFYKSVSTIYLRTYKVFLHFFSVDLSAQLLIGQYDFFLHMRHRLVTPVLSFVKMHWILLTGIYDPGNSCLNYYNIWVYNLVLKILRKNIKFIFHQLLYLCYKFLIINYNKKKLQWQFNTYHIDQKLLRFNSKHGTKWTLIHLRQRLMVKESWIKKNNRSKLKIHVGRNVIDEILWASLVSGWNSPPPLLLLLTFYNFFLDRNFYLFQLWKNTLFVCHVCLPNRRTPVYG